MNIRRYTSAFNFRISAQEIRETSRLELPPSAIQLVDQTKLQSRCVSQSDIYSLQTGRERADEGEWEIVVEAKVGKRIGMDTHRITAKTISLTTQYSALFILPLSCVADDDGGKKERKVGDKTLIDRGW